MDVLQAIFEQLQIISECLCDIRDAIKEQDLDVKYDTCEFTSSGLPKLEQQTLKLKPPKFIHDTIQKLIDEFIDIKSTSECEKIPTIQVAIQPQFITCGDDDPETVDNCNIVLQVPQSGDISIAGLPDDQIEPKKQYFVIFFQSYFDLFFSVVLNSLNQRYGQRDPVTGYFLNAQGNPVQSIDPKDVQRKIPDTDLDCINAAWTSALLSWTVVVPLGDAEKHYADILADTLARINQCFGEESSPCVPVIFGEKVETRDFPPQLHLYFERFPIPQENKDKRHTFMVIPFPKFPNGDPALFDPLPFKDAVRKVGRLYANARWADYNPSRDVTAGFFADEEKAKEFFDKFIFPYTELTPLQSEPDPVTGIITKTSITTVTNKRKRLGDYDYKVTRIIYLHFDEDGNCDDCRDWRIPLS